VLSVRMAIAEPLTANTLLAQQVVEGLPPPPTDPAPVQAMPPAIDRSAAPASPSSGSLTGELTSTSAPESTPDAQYMVYVNGDSPLLLDQVQRIEADAFLQTYDGQQVIQAGLFNEENSAKRQIQALETQGIGAEVVAISPSETRAQTPVSSQSIVRAASVPPIRVAANSDVAPSDLLPLVSADRVVPYGQPPPTVAPYNPAQADVLVAAAARTYYVVIPGSSASLMDISNLVTTLGNGEVPETAIQERRSPLGSHVLVGPFTNRSTASRWNRYFRDFGMDARIYYGR
jgi:hypothetical protein